MKKLMLILLFLGCEGQSENRIPPELPPLVVQETTVEFSVEVIDSSYTTDEMVISFDTFTLPNSLTVTIAYDSTNIEFWYTASDTTNLF